MKVPVYVPAAAAKTLHVYVETFNTLFGPVVPEQLFTTAPSVIDHDPSGEGATAPTGPVTTAVKVKVDPNKGVVEGPLTVIAGALWVTVVKSPDIGGVGK